MMEKITFKSIIDNLKARFMLNKIGLILIFVGAIASAIIIILTSLGIIFAGDRSASNFSGWFLNMIIWIVIIMLTLKFGQRR